MISRLEPADLDGLIELMAEHADYERASFDPANKLAALRQAFFAAPPRLLGWVAMDGGALVGYATASREFSTLQGREFLHLDCLFVRETTRGRGLGKALLQAVVEEARRLRIEHLEWQTPAWNEDAIRFYHREGATAASKARFSLSVHSTSLA
ncbi:MAG: acetyltransferase [Rhodospirillales bacterium]|nr:acetyltransferase [Rhodospirillales bacterium]